MDNKEKNHPETNNFNDNIKKKNFEYYEFNTCNKNKQLEKNKFNTISASANNNNIFLDKNHFMNIHYFKEELNNNINNNNLTRSASNGNSINENMITKIDKTISLYDNDEFSLKELSELSTEAPSISNIINGNKQESLFVEKKLNTHHFKIPTSIINTNYNKSELIDKNLNSTENISNFNNNPLNNKPNFNKDSCSPKSNYILLDNGQEKYSLERSLRDISNIDLNESNKSLKKLYNYPNTIFNSNTITVDKEKFNTENGSERIRIKEDNDGLANNRNFVNLNNNDENSCKMDENSKKATANKFCFQIPFIPKSLKEQNQKLISLNSNNFSNNNFNFTNCYNYPYNCNSIYNNNSSLSAYNYRPSILNYELNFLKLNSSTNLNTYNNHEENFQRFKILNLNNDKCPNENNSKTKTLKTNFNSIGTFKTKNSTNINSFNTTNCNYIFEGVKEKEKKIVQNRTSMNEEPHNRINLENVTLII